MRRIGQRTTEEAWQYHRGRDDTPYFDERQPGRIDLARFLIDKMLLKDLRGRPLRFVELGCGAGDITGPYSSAHTYAHVRGDFSTEGIEVIGIDVVDHARVACNERWPGMDMRIGPVEDMEPIDCDLLVMCEFLEHVIDPMVIVQRWLPHAAWSIIGHPLDEPDPPYEPGHNWSYTLEDWYNWFDMGNHRYWERFLFPMAGWQNMVMGHSQRL